MASTDEILEEIERKLPPGLKTPVQTAAWRISWRLGFSGRWKVRYLLTLGAKVYAVREVKNLTGASLKDSKAWVDKQG